MLASAPHPPQHFGVTPKCRPNKASEAVLCRRTAAWPAVPPAAGLYPDAMELVADLFVLAHLLGMAAIVGSAVFVARGRATPALVWGARAQLLTGLILVGLAEMGGESVDNTKVGVKLAVAVAVAACAEIAAAKVRKGQGERPQLVQAAGWLAVLNVVVAVLWP